MRFNEIIAEAILTELKMSPSFLQKLASKVEGATVGMEFEMLVPGNYGTGDYDDENLEPDYDQDTFTRSIEQVVEFFSQTDDYGGGEVNSPRDLRELQSDLEEKMFEWGTTQHSESFDIDHLADYIELNEWNEEDAIEEILDELGYSLEEYQQNKELKLKVRELERKKRADFVEEVWEERSRNRIYERAFDDYMENIDYDDRAWLENNYPRMTDIENSFDIRWPIYTNVNSHESDIEDLASDFQQAVGRKVITSDSYHGTNKTNTQAYYLEPDSSVEDVDADNDVAGLEFVSPPLPIAEMIADLAKVKEWAGRNGCYTNESCGLHMNVSIANLSPETLDYVKFAIFLGDNYILEQFGREGNTYCKSAINKIKQRAKNHPNAAVSVMTQMQDNMNRIASRLIHDLSTDKYTSINVKEGGRYVEIRSPGGDWLNADIEVLKSTLYRIVVALDAACDVQKYKQEYATKLYKLISPEGDDMIQLFAQLSAGTMTAEEFKTAWAIKVMNAPTPLKTGAGISAFNKAEKIVTKGKRFRWDVSIDTDRGTMFDNLVGSTREEVISHFRTKYNLPRAKYPDNMFDVQRTTEVVTPTQPAPEPAAEPQGRWQRWNVTFNDGRQMPVSARTHHEAEQAAIRATNRSGDDIASIVLDTA